MAGQFLYFKQRYCIIEVISQNIIMIYQFPEFVSQYKDRYPHSVKSEVKKHLNHLKVENIWKMQFSQQKSGLSNYTIYFYSKNNISSSFIKPHCHLKKYSC